MKKTCEEIDVSIKPFLKWAGGKSWITSRLKNFIPNSYNNYHELFLGSGAVFFYLSPHKKSFLSDLNSELINTYCQIKKDPLTVIDAIDQFENNEVSYYKVRANKMTDKIYNAARFIYLNKTCYNGIYRVNSTGQFNVPYGHNPSGKIYDKENLLAISKRLKKAKLCHQDFGKALNFIEKKDLVFIDPPYTVAHNNNGFIEYNQKIFSWDDQERLADFVNEISKRKAYFIVTNAVHKSIEKLYATIGKRFEIERHSSITSKIENRRRISEYLITNCI